MKTVLCKLIILSLVIGIFTGCEFMHIINGNGNPKTSELTVSAFEKIDCSGSAEVRYFASDDYRVEYTIDSNLDEYVKIDAKNNVLNIRLQKGYAYSYKKFLVDVYCPVITRVEISGSVSFEGVDKIITSRFESIVSGSGKVKGRFDCQDFIAKSSGSSEMTISGNSKNTIIDISGSGDFCGNDFLTKNATIKVSGSGDITIGVEEYLKATISGSGNISYWGNPTVDKTISGSGNIKKLG
jgi:hypothetical protein